MAVNYRLTKDHWFTKGHRVPAGTVLRRATLEEFETAFSEKLRNLLPVVVGYEGHWTICLWFDGKPRLFDRRFAEIV